MTIAPLRVPPSDPLILALETSGPRGGVALGRGDQLLSAEHVSGERRHAAEIHLLIDRVLRRHGLAATQIEVIALSAGPGSFTGLRIGAAIARTMQAVTRCQVCLIDSLEVLASNALRLALAGTRVIAMCDAQQGHVFAEVFDVHGAPSDPQLVAIRPVERVNADGWIGSIAPDAPLLLGVPPLRKRQEWSSLGAVIPAVESEHVQHPESVWRIGQRLAQQGQFADPHEIVPAYLRSPEAATVYESRLAEARRRRAARDDKPGRTSRPSD